MNDAVEQIAALDGKVVSIVGALSLDFEGRCINHIPMSETIYGEFGESQSSIWADFDLEAIGHDVRWLRQFDKRYVRVLGVLAAPEPRFGGCGHLSMWPAEILIKAIEKK